MIVIKVMYSCNQHPPQSSIEIYKGERGSKSIDTYSLGIMLYQYFNNNQERLKLKEQPQEIDTILIYFQLAVNREIELENIFLHTGFSLWDN